MVLFVSYSGAFGGAERLLLEIAPAVEHPAVACPEGPLAHAARAGGLRVLALPGRSIRARGSASERLLALAGLAAHAREIRRLVDNLDPELLVAWGMRSALGALLWPGLRCPVAFQHNDLLPTPAIGALVRTVAGRASRVLVPSRSVAQDLDPFRRLGDRLQTVHPGVELERFASERPPVSPPEVLVLGAITAWKRPELALEACALARLQVGDLRVRLVGEPFAEDGSALLDRLTARAAAPDLAGAVELAGAVSDPAEDLSRATCLLHCAEREPFGIAVLEALAAGRPAVVPAAGGPAEVVDDSCGFMYPPGDACAAAAGITRLVGDPELAARMGAAARERARREFDVVQARSRYAAAFEPVLATGRRARPASTSRPPCCVLTVTHNSAGHLRALSASAGAHLPGARVVVVDCASADDSVAVAQDCPRVQTISLPENVGFGRACNIGIAEVHEPVTILVNPDVELVDDSLLTLVAEVLRSDRGERLLAPLVLSPDGSRQDSVHPAPTSAADLLRSLVPPAIVPGRPGVMLAPWRSRSPRGVGWAVGCAIVARTETLRRLGPFDEQIFLYGEDLELGLRAGAQGVQSWFWPEGRVLHHGAHSSSVAFGGEPFERLAAARREVVALRLGARRAHLDVGAQALMFASRIALKRALRRPAARERRQLIALARSRRPARGAVR